MILSLYAALLAMLFIALSVHVIRGRYALKLALGDAGNHAMQRRIRAQGNFVEYTPLFLLLLGLSEHNGLAAYGVHALGILFLLGRLSHAYSLLRTEHYEQGILVSGGRHRMLGMICTFLSLSIVSVILLVQYGQNA